jgi:hypothetical protein
MVILKKTEVSSAINAASKNAFYPGQSSGDILE